MGIYCNTVDIHVSKILDLILVEQTFDFDLTKQEVIATATA